MSLIRRLPLLAGLVVVPVALAQDADAPKEQPVLQQAPVVFRQATPQPAPQPVLPPFESMVVRGPDGKIVRIERQLDLLALHRNSLVDDATRERVRPVLREWLMDLDQLVIDNLDFLERIEPPDGSPGVIERIDLNDASTVQPVAQMMNQLIAAGPLTAHLQSRGVLTREQADLNQRIISDYLQQVMNEVLAANQVPAARGDQPQNQEERNLQVNTVSRHLYALSARDAISSYYRQLQSAAPYAEQIAAATEMTSEQREKIAPLVGTARSAQTEIQRRQGVRRIMNELSFDQRREFLQRAKEVVPELDGLSKPAQ
jgi:hypothetical protein